MGMRCQHGEEGWGMGRFRFPFRYSFRLLLYSKHSRQWVSGVARLSFAVVVHLLIVLNRSHQWVSHFTLQLNVLNLNYLFSMKSL